MLILTDILPKYNNQWKLAFDDGLKALSVKDLLANGTINTNENERTYSDLNNIADNPAESTTLPDKFNFDYVNSQVQLKISENTNIKDTNLQASNLNNIAKWVNTKINITGLRTFVKEFGTLFNGFFETGDNDIDTDDLTTDDIYNTSDVDGRTLTDALEWLKQNGGGTGGASNFEGLHNDTTVAGDDGKDVINHLHTQSENNVAAISSNGDEILENTNKITINKTNINTLSQKTSNLNPNGTVENIPTRDKDMQQKNM